MKKWPEVVEITQMDFYLESVFTMLDSSAHLVFALFYKKLKFNMLILYSKFMVTTTS